jgi:hypothetical protein
MKTVHLLAAFLLLLIPSLASPACAAVTQVEPQTDGMGREYFLYLPPQLDPHKTYWLFVGVHGAGGNGKGACGMADFVQLGNCIVVGPSFPDSYQGLGAQSDEQLIKLFAELGKKYKLHDRLFVAGFSGGSQFAHRFALAHPETVIGCAAHSSGSWATGDLPGDVTPAEKAPALVPMVISCGMNDTGKAFPSVPMDRIDFAHKFESAILQKDGFLYRAAYIPNTGHAPTKTSLQLSVDCYWLATTGLAPDERQAFDSLLQPIATMVRMHNFTAAAKRLEVLPAIWEKARAAVRAARPKTDTALVPGWKGGTAIEPELELRAKQYVQDRCEELRAAMPAHG